MSIEELERAYCQKCNKPLKWDEVENYWYCEVCMEIMNDTEFLANMSKSIKLLGDFVYFLARKNEVEINSEKDAEYLITEFLKEAKL